jgi:hypothetical protein
MSKWMIAGLCLLTGFGIFVRAKIADVNAVNSVDDQVLLFDDHQYEFLPIAPPSDAVFVQGFDQAVPVSWNRFPREFALRMDPEIDADGYPIYRMSM